MTSSSRIRELSEPAGGDDDLHERYLARLARLGIDPETLAADPEGTLVLSPSSTPRVTQLPTLSSLFALEERFAVGSMGEIHVGKQHGLDRRVAVKVPLDDHDATASLMREARVTGALEHPNIIPVYALGRDAEGRPLLAMKHITGQSWSEVLELDAPEKRYPTTARDRLAFHLDVLMQVCGAVHYAHEKGLIHRDLKPDNVMIGPHGEVYVLDWGLAVAIHADGERWALPASDVRHIAGTPEYMAPELAAADGSAIGRTTDVYLLGALLHAVLTGAPRHEGASMRDVLLAAYVSAPVDYPSDVAPELAEIANRATARLPTKRFATALDLRFALAAFARRADSRRLEEDAQRRLTALEELLDKRREGAPIDAAITHRVGIEARHSFQQALEIWPDNQEARAGRERALVLLFHDQVARENRDEAAALLDEMMAPAEELEASLRRLDETLRRRAQKLRDLEALSRETTVTAFDRRRRIAAVLMGVVLMCLIAPLGYLNATGQRTTSYLDVICLVAAFFGASWLATRYLMRSTNLIERRVNWVYLAAIAALAPFLGLAWLADVRLQVALSLGMFLMAVTAGIAALTLIPHLIWVSLTYAATALAMLLLPQHVDLILPIGNLIGFALMGVFRWRGIFAG